ncbi:hypothetical protein HK100_007068 [Physocladia obscura]|uniref:U three protein 23 n=1 Tax=Physocladia obscura TaxID=109957 RepID=A0AAD5XK62_9FUNG|nr:hypothetical protein HK100_007068 [Physocladia obscura]
MRVKRAKGNKKTMSVYAFEFGFREPYQLLLDGNFLHVANQMKMDMFAQLPKVLQGSIRLYTTPCVMSELRALGPDFAGAVSAATNVERRRCGHDKPIGATACLTSVIGEDNKHRFGVASQDLNLRKALRKVSGTPLIELQKTLPRKFEENIIKKISPESKIAEPARTFKKRAKAPNPLSMKKRQNGKSATNKSGPETDEMEALFVGRKRNMDPDDYFKSHKRRK